MEKKFVVALDGPAASGKGTIGRHIAAEFGFSYLDTGKLYRLLALQASQLNIAPNNCEEIAELAVKIKIGNISQIDLSSETLGQLAAKYSPNKSVRDALLELQRKFSLTQPGAVLDGRDIGTVVCPDADVKLFVTATAEIRAERRQQEEAKNGSEKTYEQILSDIIARDERDSARKDSPMQQADNALLLDTSKMDIETAFQAAKTIVDVALNKNTNT